MPITVAGPEVYSLREDSAVGGEVYERMLLERLGEHGVELVLGMAADPGLAPPARVEVLRRGVGRHWLTAPLALTAPVVRWCRSGRVDVLRAHSVRHCAPAVLLGRAIARSRLPVVVHHHHLTARWTWLEAAILRRADAVVTVSEHSRDQVVARGVAPARVHVVHDGVARIPPTGGWANAWPEGSPRLLYLSRLEPRKRPGLAVETLARLRASGVEASLVLAGAGPLRGELEQRVATLGLGASVRLLGHVADADKWRLYDSADVLLFGSTVEGFGLVVAEAQSRGLPVVAAAGTATAEALDPGRSGLLAAPEADAFAAAVRELSDPARHAACSAAARSFAERFDWDRCAAGVARVMAELAR